MDSPFLLALAAVTAVGCASSDFKVGTTSDGAVGDTEPADTATDTGTGDGGGDGGACPPLGDSGEILVDSNTAATTSNGTATCPFKTIRDALAVTNTTVARTVRVRGTSGGRVYTETGSLVVKTGITLASDSIGSVVVQGAGGVCAGSGSTCIVQVNKGATLDGFIVKGTTSGVTLVSISGSGTASAPPAVVKNTRATKAAGDGGFAFLVNDGGQLGPNVEGTQNPAVPGLQIYGSAPVRVIGPNTVFNNNLYGIRHEGGGVLTIEAGVATNSNTKSGVLVNTALGVVHSFSVLTAGANGDAGVFMQSGSLVLRNSQLHGDNRIGLIANGSASVTLDLGTDSGVGNNFFGTNASGSAARNKQAGICLDPFVIPVNAVGDKFSICPPSQGTIDGACTDALSGYHDIRYRTGATGTIVTKICSPG